MLLEEEEAEPGWGSGGQGCAAFSERGTTGGSEKVGSEQAGGREGGSGWGQGLPRGQERVQRPRGTRTQESSSSGPFLFPSRLERI